VSSLQSCVLIFIVAFVSVSHICQVTHKSTQDKNNNYHSSSQRMLAMYFHSLRKVIVFNKRIAGAVCHTRFAFSNYSSFPGVFKVMLQNMSNSTWCKTAHNFSA